MSDLLAGVSREIIIELFIDINIGSFFSGSIRVEISSSCIRISDVDNLTISRFLDDFFIGSILLCCAHHCIFRLLQQQSESIWSDSGLCGSLIQNCTDIS